MLLSGVAILTFIQIVSSYNNGVGQRPVMGWNTWCSIEGCGTDICNQWEVVSIAQAMKSNGMYDAGYDHVNMDDCWDACERDKNGNIQPDPDRFPDGIKALADNLHNLGFKFGLYTSAGSTTCSSGTRKCPGGSKPPGSYGHYADDTKTFASWGVDYVKIDWCGSDLTNAQKQHTEFSNDLNATGRHVFLELCRGYGYPPPPYVAQVANSWRITGDHHDDWGSTANAIAHSANATNLSGVYNWAYNDFLMTGGEGCIDQTLEQYKHCPGQTNIEYMTEFAIFAISGSPLLVATDIRAMTDIMKKVLLNKDIIAINQNIKYGPGNIVSSETTNCDKNVSNACQVWSKQLETNSAAVVLFNAGDAKHDISFDFSSIPGMSWTQTTKLDLKDLWQKKDVGSFTGKYTGSNIDVHGVQFLLATQS
eukprot:5417_1